MTEQEFYAILAAMPEPKPIFYRLYYNSDGSPQCYTMEDLPGTWIDIDRETYLIANPWVRVVNGKLKKISRLTVNKLVPSDQGTPCHPQNVAVVDFGSNKTWSKQIYGLE